MSILDYFPGTPRLAQKQILESIESQWNLADVFVIQAPVATGKSRCAITIARWAGSAGILTPNNMLTRQYAQDFPDIPTLHGRARYEDPEDYEEARDLTKESDTFITNYWCYKLHRLYRRVIIADEAHNLLPMILGNHTVKLNRERFGWDDSVNTTADLLEWAAAQNPSTVGDRKLLELIQNVAVPNESVYSISKNADEIKFQPLTARYIDHGMFPPWVPKVVLMSATISEEDIIDLGLAGRRVAYIACDSPIPAVNRPFVVQVVGGSVGGGREAFAAEALAQRIRELAHRHAGRNGLVHCTYKLARFLHPYLRDDSRFIFHAPHNKTQRYQEFRNSAGSVLIASGMYEGIDLPYDAARWQAICKVPYPNLTDGGVAELAKARPRQYAWRAIRDVVQAYGRVCRAPDDLGLTYMLDPAWKFLADSNRNLLPLWFLPAIMYK